MERMSLLILPEDVLLAIMKALSASDLAALSLTNRRLHVLIEAYGWKDYVRLHPRPFTSLTRAVETWDAKTIMRYNSLTDRAWNRGDVAARPLARPWQGKLRSAMAVSPSRLVIAAGDRVYSYSFTLPSSSAAMEPSGVHLEAAFTLPYSQAPDVPRDVSSVAFLPDGGHDCTLCIGFADGAVERIIIPTPDTPETPTAVAQGSRALMEYVPGDLVSSLSTCGDLLLSLSTSGRVKLQLTSTSIPDSTVSTLQLDIEQKAWVAYLSSSFAAFGTSSSTPLAIHPLTETGLTHTPTTLLAGGKRRNSAVYGLCNTPPGAPWGASDQILVSGWFDGVVRVHDLRFSPHSSIDELDGLTPASLSPVLSLWDPWSYEPVYAVAFGGGACAHAAAGAARHSLVAFWDVRFSSSPASASSGGRRSNGWSVYASGSERSSSPVYALHLESSRLFGTTQSAPFVLDFGPGVGLQTYDYVPTEEPRGAGARKARKVPAHGQVTKYLHSTGVVDH